MRDLDALDDWYFALPIEVLPPRGGSPEDRCFDAVVHAWSRGFRAVVSLPVAGDYAERLGRHCLLVSAATRADPQSYDRALRENF